MLRDYDTINSQDFFTYSASNAYVYSTAQGLITNIFDGNVSTTWFSDSAYYYNYFQFALNSPQPAKSIRFYNFNPGGSNWDWVLYGTNNATAWSAARANHVITEQFEDDWRQLVAGEYLDSNSNPQYGQTSWIEKNISILV